MSDGNEAVPGSERIDELEAENERLRAENREATETVSDLKATIEEVADAMAAAANGDLTRPLDVDTADEDVYALARSFDSMRTEFARTLSTAQEFAEDVDETSQNATTVAEDVRKKAEQVTDSTANINDATDEQRQKIESVSSEMSDLSATIEEITSTAENVAVLSEETAERGAAGQESAEQAIDELDQIQAETERARASVEELTDYMEEIGDIVDFITDIAEQTNMLALNANIEAARAGEDGHGFAVVADEVKSLAEETKDAAEDIEALIRDIRNQTEETAEGMDEVSASVETGTMTVEAALEALSGIAEQATETNAGVQEIKNATNEQADTAQEVAQMADDVARLSATTADETDRVTAAMEAHREQFSTVVSSIKELSGQVTFLREELSDFDLDVEQTVQRAGATSADLVTSQADVTGDAVVVGSKMYTANSVLSYMVYELLAETTDLQPVADFERGKTMANFDGVRSGETDLYWSYTGTIVRQFLDSEYDPASLDETYQFARDIESEYDLNLGERTGMNQGYCLSAPRVWCDETGVRTISDLMDLMEDDPSLTVAYESDFRDRDDGWAGLLDAYDVSDEARQRVADNALIVEETKDRYDLLSTRDADVIQGLTVDAWIDVHDLDVLADDDDFFPSYQPVPLVNGETARTHLELLETVNRIGPTLQDVTELRRLVRQIKIGNKDPRFVARRHLRKHGLL